MWLYIDRHVLWALQLPGRLGRGVATAKSGKGLEIFSLRDFPGYEQYKEAEVSGSLALSFWPQDWTGLPGSQESSE